MDFGLEPVVNSLVRIAFGFIISRSNCFDVIFRCRLSFCQEVCWLLLKLTIVDPESKFELFEALES